ncbi:hypothetical protein BDB00DRAFT_845232 [Zychaea mexicana]|uniref:uncharacterized protein n=1 Tax=Zychaea mexicana TaxID=64656 RepID=UPI0022FF34D9|nr:uncharacterized protein BDB00DRAFT_845232 [Zychaea mexicana]KAI9489117.1 hypothetical protein BDB00DRAFT_845232 [Zychaea mexicana]
MLMMMLSNISRQTLSRRPVTASSMPRRIFQYHQQLPPSQRLQPGPLIPRPTQPQSVLITTRNFSIWRIPFYWATATKAKRRVALLGSLSGLTMIGAVLGPAFWLVLGGVGTIVTWRIWQQTKRWWQLLNPSEQMVASLAKQGGEGLMQLLRRQVGSHQAAEEVQRQAINKLIQWARTDQGRRVLVDELNVAHVDDITFYPPHSCSLSSQTVVTNGKESSGQKVHVEFWAEADRSVHPRSGSCCIYADAITDGSGNIQMKDIRLAAPGWHADEHIPLDQPKSENVIEGAFRDV